jgi:hypothetical protein
MLDACNLENLISPNVLLFNSNIFAFKARDENMLRMMISRLSTTKFISKQPMLVRDNLNLNPLLNLIMNRSTTSLSTLTDCLPDYQAGPMNVKVFDGYLSKLIKLNVNIEEILGSETVWETLQDPLTLPTIGYNHKYSYTSPYNPTYLQELQMKEKGALGSKAGAGPHTISDLTKSPCITNASVPHIELIVKKSGNKISTGQYSGTSFKEVLSY